ncbi:MAG: MATE family efflux transporter [Clostridiales bacterium]|nr:MATE family efflux transporter [Clostridiales bacterium]
MGINEQHKSNGSSDDMEKPKAQVNGAHKEQSVDFTTGSIFQKLLKFMLPILGAQILVTMYGAVDIIVVGWFGSEAGISAVSTGSSLINMVVLILNALAMGVTILMSRYIGEKKQKRLDDVIGGAVFVFAVIAVVMAVLLIVAAPFLAKIMQAPEAAFDLTVLYIRICGGGIFFIIGYNLVSSIFRGLGNSRLPLIFVGIACAVNVFADLLFVAVFKWDVAGAALATVMAQGISLVMSIVVCSKMELPFNLSVGNIRPNEEIRTMLFLGFPIAFQEFLTQISFMCLLSFVNAMGSTEAIRLASSSGYGIANKLVGVVMLVPGSLMQSMSSVVAQNVGAGQEGRARKAMGYGMLIGAVIGIFIAAAAFFDGNQLARIFSSDAVYQAKAAEYLRGFAPEAIVTSVLFSFIGYFNGHNQTYWVLVQGILQSFLVRLPMAYFMSVLFPDSLVYIGLSAPTATVFGILLNVGYFIFYAHKQKRKPYATNL